MKNQNSKLNEWLAAGLITADQLKKIQGYEE
jgi:hypothetical protein